MRKIVAVLPIAVLTLVGWLVPHAAAQDTKTARGTVTAVSPTSLGIKAGAQEMKFAVDAKTDVTAPGAGTATRQATAAGKGVALPEMIKVGENVEVRYHEMAGALHAASIRRITDAGAGGGTPSVAQTQTQTQTADGTVESITGKTLTVAGSGGSKQVFVVDTSTKVVGEGVGTATAAAGGKTAITGLVGKGDRVTVTYQKMGDGLHASEIRIRTKAK